MGGACSAYGGEERCIQGFGGEMWGGKRPLGRTRRRWEDNIKVDVQEVRCGGIDWMELVQGRDRKQGSGENYIMRSFVICIPHPILFG